MDLVTNDVKSAPATPAVNSLVVWVVRGYFAVVLSLILVDFVSEYRLVRLDARVHRLMSSAPAITIDQIKSALSDVIENQEEVKGGDPVTDVAFDFGNPYRRSMYVHFDPKSGTVTGWSMMATYSDVVDTARAADGRAVRALSLRFSLLAVVALSPIPFWWLHHRVSRRATKIALQLACVPLGFLSVCVGLLEALRLTFFWDL